MSIIRLQTGLESIIIIQSLAEAKVACHHWHMAETELLALIALHGVGSFCYCVLSSAAIDTHVRIHT